MVGLLTLLSGSIATADTVVLSSGPIECEVVRLDSSYARLRLASGGILMVPTDSIREIRYSGPAQPVELKPLFPQAADTIGTAPAVPTAVPKPALPDAIRPATPLIVAGEAGAGLLGGLALTLPVSAVGSQLAIWIAGDPDKFSTRLLAAIDGSNIGALVGFAAGGAIGVSLVGRRFHQGGQLWASSCGALVGTAACLLLFDPESPMVLAVLLPQVGAVLGYNWSRPKPAPTGSFLDRVEMPAVALWQDTEQQSTGVNVRLVCVRF